MQILTNCRNSGQKRAGGLSLDEAIAELEAMQAEIKNLSSKCAEIAYDFENAVNEIELLKQCVEEAIKRPMGVEPSIYSDYKMSKSK